MDPWSAGWRYDGDGDAMSGDNPVAGAEPTKTAANRVGLYSSILTVVMTLVTFGLAITAVPNSGAGCLENCFEYPYLNTLSEFPGDYLWMPPAMILVVVYVILVVIHPRTRVPTEVGVLPDRTLLRPDRSRGTPRRLLCAVLRGPRKPYERTD